MERREPWEKAAMVMEMGRGRVWAGKLGRQAAFLELILSFLSRAS